MSNNKVNQLPFDPAEERYVSLATYRRNGKEVSTPVWMAKADDCYYVFSEAKAGKVKRIRANAKSRMAACSARGDIRSDWIESNARIVTETELIDRAYIALRKKYGWQMTILDLFSKLSGRYDKRAIIELVIVQGD